MKMNGSEEEVLTSLTEISRGSRVNSSTQSYLDI